MYQVLPAKMKNIDTATSLHPKILSSLYPKFWRVLMGLELKVNNKDNTTENFEKLSADLMKIPDNQELNRVAITRLLDGEGLIPITMPSFSRDENDQRKWHAYYQKPGTIDASNPNGRKDVRIGIGEFNSRAEAETTAIYKCLDLLEAGMRD